MPTINDRIGSQNIIRVLANASAPPTRINNLIDVVSTKKDETTADGYLLIWNRVTQKYDLGNDIPGGLNVQGISTFTSHLDLGEVNFSGVSTAPSFVATESIAMGATTVITAARELQNIASLDATTTATIESAITNAPNTFTDLQITGLSTFLGAARFDGVATFNNGIHAPTGVATIASLNIADEISISQGGLDVTGHTELDNLNVSGVSTFNDDVKFIGASTNAIWDKSGSNFTLYDNTRLEFGSNTDFEIWHGGSHTFMKNTGGDLRIRGDKILLKREDGSETYLEANVNNEVKLFFNGNEKFATTKEGVIVSGGTTTGSLSVTGVSTFNDDIKFIGASYDALWDQATSKLKLYDLAQATYGDGNDLQIYSDGTTAIIKGNDKTKITGISELSVSGVSTFTGIVTTTSDLYVGGDLYITDDLVLDNVTGNSLRITGLSTFVGDAKFDGNVSIAGTLTYEDVTNVDSVGIVTAGKGVRVTTGGIVVTAGISTFSAAIDANAGADISGGVGLNVVGHTELDYVNVSAAATFKEDVEFHGNSGTNMLYWDKSADALKLADLTKLQIGTGLDLQLYHNLDFSYIDNNTGHLYIRNNVDDDDGGNIYLQAKSGEDSLIANDDGSVEVFYDGARRIETLGAGTTFTDDVFTNRFFEGYGAIISGVVTATGGIDGGSY